MRPADLLGLAGTIFGVLSVISLYFDGPPALTAAGVICSAIYASSSVIVAVISKGGDA